MTRSFSGVETRVSRLNCCKVDWVKKNGDWKLKELPKSDFTLDADLVLLAMGFLHPVHEGLAKGLGLQLDERGNIAVNDYQTSEPWVFAAGDAASGASLVVTAIDSGRRAATAINRWLAKSS